MNRALACVAGVKRGRGRGRGNLGARERVGRGRSLKFSSSFPAISVLLCTPLDPIRPDRNSKRVRRRVKVAKSRYISY